MERYATTRVSYGKIIFNKYSSKKFPSIFWKKYEIAMELDNLILPKQL